MTKEELEIYKQGVDNMIQLNKEHEHIINQKNGEISDLNVKLKEAEDKIKKYMKNNNFETPTNSNFGRFENLNINSIKDNPTKIYEMIVESKQKLINELNNEVNDLKEKISLKESTGAELLSLIKSLEKKVEDLTKENSELKQKLSQTDIEKRLTALEEYVKKNSYGGLTNPLIKPYQKFDVHDALHKQKEAEENMFKVQPSPFDLLGSGVKYPVNFSYTGDKIDNYSVTTNNTDGVISVNTVPLINNSISYGYVQPTNTETSKEECSKNTNSGSVTVTMECNCDHEEDAVCSKGCGYQNPVDSKVESKKTFEEDFKDDINGYHYIISLLKKYQNKSKNLSNILTDEEYSRLYDNIFVYEDNIKNYDDTFNSNLADLAMCYIGMEDLKNPEEVSYLINKTFFNGDSLKFEEFLNKKDELTKKVKEKYRAILGFEEKNKNTNKEDKFKITKEEILSAIKKAISLEKELGNYQKDKYDEVRREKTQQLSKEVKNLLDRIEAKIKEKEILSSKAILHG